MPTDKQRQYMKQYDQKRNRDPIRKSMKNKYHKKYSLTNRDKLNDINSTWYHKNKHRINRDRQNMRQSYRDKLFDILGGARCIRCGFSDKRALQFDHINGGGSFLIRKKENRDHHYYVKYANNPELAKSVFQVLCANCNAIKRHERYKSPLYNSLKC